MNQYYKQAIIRNPVVASLQELDEQAMMVPFLRKCYGNWERDEDESFCQHPVSPASDGQVRPPAAAHDPMYDFRSGGPPAPFGVSDPHSPPAVPPPEKT